jgi:energy-coupling factor transporter transmembrane protein EcfT
MEWLGKLLFPKNPKMVRYRKLQLVFIAIIFSVLCCALVGLLIYFLSRSGY